MDATRTTRNVGLPLLLDHARQGTPPTPRHCNCRGCRLGHGHNPAVAR